MGPFKNIETTYVPTHGSELLGRWNPLMHLDTTFFRSSSYRPAAQLHEESRSMRFRQVCRRRCGLRHLGLEVGEPPEAGLGRVVCLARLRRAACAAFVAFGLRHGRWNRQGLRRWLRVRFASVVDALLLGRRHRADGPLFLGPGPTLSNCEPTPSSHVAVSMGRVLLGHHSRL